jgi:hypothetical protein
MKAYDYKDPIVTSVSTARGQSGGTAFLPVGAPPTGKSTVSIVGSGFGYVDTRPKASIGSTSCRTTEWISDTSLRCTIQGEYPAAGFYDVNVLVGTGKNQIFHVLPNALSSSSPTCADMLQRMPSRANKPGKYLLDPTLGSPSDGFKAHCAMGAERADVLKAEIGLPSNNVPIFWLDPVSGSSFDMQSCTSSPLVAGWNENVFALNHAPCSSAITWRSRSQASIQFTASASDMDVLPLWKYDPDIELPMLGFAGSANKTYMSANVRRPQTGEVTIVLAFRAKGPGWIISDNDLQATAPLARGVGIFLDDFGVPGVMHVRVVSAAESGFMSAVPILEDDGVVHIVTLVATSTSLKLWLDGSLEDGFDMQELLDGLGPLPDTNPNPGTRTLQLGRRATLPFLQQYFKGDLGDLLVFDYVLPDFVRETVEHSLCVKWGAPGCSDGHAGTLTFSDPDPPVVMSSTGKITLSVERSRGGPAGRADGSLMVSYWCDERNSSEYTSSVDDILSLSAEEQLNQLSGNISYSSAIRERDFMPIPSGSVLEWVTNETGPKNFTVNIVADGTLRRPRTFSCHIAVAQAYTEVTRIVTQVNITVRDPVCGATQTSTASEPCLQYRPTYWTGVVGSAVGSSGGGYDISVLGQGFDPASTYSCEFYVGPYTPASPPASRRVSSRAWVISNTQMGCTVPSWGNAQSVATMRITENGVGVPRYEPNATAGPFEFRFVPPMVMSVAPALAQTDQSATVTVTGRNFGFSAPAAVAPLRVWMGETSTIATWISDTSVRTTLLPGTGSTPLCVAVNDLRGCSLSISFTLDRLLRPNETEPAQEAIRQWISQFADVPVANIVPLQVAASGARRLLTTSTLTMAVLTSNVNDLPLSIENQQLSLNTGAVAFTATTSVDPGNTFVYDVPKIISLIPSSHTPTVPGDALTVTFTGSNFGMSDSTPQASIGNTRCVRTTWISNTRISCLTAAGVGQNLPVYVTVSGRVGVGIAVYSYRPQLTVTGVSPSNGPVVGGGDLTVFGSRFGQVDNTPIVRIGATACASSRWLGDSAVLCRRVSAGFDRSLPVRVSVSLMEGSALAAYTYNAPLITKIAPANGPPGGNSTFVTVSGVNFGLTPPASASCYVGERDRPLVWISDTSAVSAWCQM